ncbi:MAG: mannose-1-phosphate guanylyltransferase/mannose-6-phosphate isomerase [Nitrospirota bacterium]
MYAVIIAGGSGSRFWPLSREMTPKQLLKINGDETMIQQTISRIEPLIDRERTYIVTNAMQAEEIIIQMPSHKRERKNFIIEPAAKNTAPAIGMAAIFLNHIDPDSVMVVLPADHVINRGDKFLEILKDGEEIANKGYLVTLGIKPTRPETGYGYIKTEESLTQNSKLKTQNSTDVYLVDRFVEKPDKETAIDYINNGNYYWNSGIFIWKTSRILEEIRLQLPDLDKSLKEIDKIGEDDIKKEDIIREIYSCIKPISIDNGIMEGADKVAVIPANIGWNDVGSWNALDEVSDRDINGNIINGNIIDIDSRDSIIYSGKRLVATIGLKDMVVVDTDDATLVCKKDKAQDVKRIVEELRDRNAEECFIHRTVERPWGKYTVLENGDRYKIKKIIVNPGARLSLQLHYHRSEHWIVVSGTARVTAGERVFYIHENESTYIPIATRHRLENPGRIPLHIIEVQNGAYLEENDIVRLTDDYERPSTSQ